MEYSPQHESPFAAQPTHSDHAKPLFEDLATPLLFSLYNFAWWLAHNQHDAEDLVQETYLKALRNFASFEPGTNFRAWMLRILKNTFLTSRKKYGNRISVPLEVETDSLEFMATFVTPESLLMKQFNIDAVQKAIEQLPTMYREVILLCDVEGVSYREIAEILSIPIGTVMSRVARARKTLRGLLDQGRCTIRSRVAPFSSQTRC